MCSIAHFLRALEFRILFRHRLVAPGGLHSIGRHGIVRNEQQGTFRDMDDKADHNYRCRLVSFSPSI